MESQVLVGLSQEKIPLEVDIWALWTPASRLCCSCRTSDRSESKRLTQIRVLEFIRAHLLFIKHAFLKDQCVHACFLALGWFPYFRTGSLMSLLVEEGLRLMVNWILWYALVVFFSSPDCRGWGFWFSDHSESVIVTLHSWENGPNLPVLRRLTFWVKLGGWSHGCTSYITASKVNRFGSGICSLVMYNLS